MRKICIKDCVDRILWKCRDPLYNLELQVFLVAAKRDMTKHIMVRFPLLHDVRNDLPLTQQEVDHSHSAAPLNCHCDGLFPDYSRKAWIVGVKPAAVDGKHELPVSTRLP